MPITATSTPRRATAAPLVAAVVAPATAATPPPVASMLVALPPHLSEVEAVASAELVLTAHGYPPVGRPERLIVATPRALRVLCRDESALAAGILVLAALLAAGPPGPVRGTALALDLVAVAIFAAARHRRRPLLARVLRRWTRTAPAGRVRRLDLAAMRRQARAEAAHRWATWSRVVAGTRSARPWWDFQQRTDDAGAAYRAQDRLRAMRLHTADPERQCDLRTEEIEFYQAGEATYVALAGLLAVPGDGVIDATGPLHTVLLRPAGRLDEVIDYLAAANALVAGLPAAAHLVAVTC